MPVHKIFLLGSQYTQLKVLKIKNIFWKDTLNCWVQMCKKLKPNNYNELYTLPLWYNPQISETPLIIPDLYNRGINMIGDMLTNDGSIITKEDLLYKTGLNTINPLHYLRLRLSIKSLLSNYLLLPQPIQRPTIPLYIKTIQKSSKGSKDFYRILQGNRETINHDKWETMLNIYIPNPAWKRIHKICFKTLNDNYIIYLQYRIVNRILGTRSLLHKMSITDNKFCSFCKEHEETLMHLFYDCNYVLTLWNTLYDWIFNITDIRIIPDKKEIILGYLQIYPNPIPINTINLITKSYIFYCSKNNINLNIFHLQSRIKTTIETMEFLANKNNQLEKFNRIWRSFYALTT